jgi:hypothetical protein
MLETGNLHSRYPCLRFVDLREFRAVIGLFVARGAEWATVNYMGSRMRNRRN